MSKKPQHISFGGLVSINGYDGHLYFVDAFTIEHINTPDEKWSEIWHDLTDAHNGEYTMAEAEDVTRICGADQADDYLRNSVKPVDISEIIFGGVPKMYSSNRKEPRKPTARELSGQEAEKRKRERKEKAKQIDALLDEYNDYKRLADEFGDEEYRAKVEYVRLKLAEITNEGMAE